MTNKVILVRHGTRVRDVYVGEKQHGLEGFYPGDPEKWPPAEFDGSGTQVVLAMAGRLADELDREGIVVTKILHSEHVVAAETAEIYTHVLTERRSVQGEVQTPWELLTPATNGKSNAGEVARLIRECNAGVVLIVGHQPELTAIANELLTPRSKWHRRLLNCSRLIAPKTSIPVLRQFLEQHFSFYYPPDPLVALGVISDEPDAFDAVLTDLTMPGLSGTQLADKIQQAHPDIPVVLMSGNANLLDDGARVHVSKPLVTRELAECLRLVLDSP